MRKINVFDRCPGFVFWVTLIYYNGVFSVKMHHLNIAKGTPHAPSSPPLLPHPAMFVAVAAQHAQAPTAGSFPPSSGSFGKRQFIYFSLSLVSLST